MLGRSSTTEDIEGKVVEFASPPQPTLDEIRNLAETFLGETLQRPPIYSALKLGGRRAYDLARRGESVELQPRQISIYRLDVIAYEYPTLQLDIECSGGTYVRSLGRDLAEGLGTVAVMSALVRTAVGEFTLDRSVSSDDLTAANLASYTVEPAEVLKDLPTLRVSETEAAALCQGRPIRTTEVFSAPELAIFDQHDRLIALAVPQAPAGLRSSRNLG